MAKRPKMHRKPEELSQDQFEKLIKDVEEFNDKFLFALAGTDRIEVIPTISEDGRPLTKEQYTLVKNECSRLGLKIIYQIQNPDGTTTFINSENAKIGIMDNGVH